MYTLCCSDRLECVTLNYLSVGGWWATIFSTSPQEKQVCRLWQAFRLALLEWTEQVHTRSAMKCLLLRQKVVCWCWCFICWCWFRVWIFTTLGFRVWLKNSVIYSNNHFSYELYFITFEVMSGKWRNLDWLMIFWYFQVTSVPQMLPFCGFLV